jgi:alkylation response protein AidB-like acyl-CoA dehydrogenase
VVARAIALQPLLRQAAPRIEAARELPADVLDALHAAGLFRLTIPRALGGMEVDLATLMQVVEALAQADGSAAWCVGQGAGCAMTAAYLPSEAAWQMFGRDPRAVLAWGAGASGLARPVDGGWRISGNWMFASGLRHATWLGGQCPLASEDGTAQADAAGQPVVRTFVFPKAEAHVSDTWQVIGLRGTGSDSYSVADLFVPVAHCFDRTLPAPHPGALYRVPLTHLYPVAFGGVALGLAGVILGAFTALSGKTPRGAANALRDNAATQSLLGQMTTRLRAARCFLLQTTREIWADLEAGQSLTPAHALSIRMASTFAIHEALTVAGGACHEAGATAIFEAQPFERPFRDIHAVAQQVQGRRANFELVGQHLLGMTKTPLFG